MTANVVSPSDFIMKFEGNENKMMNISQFIRADKIGMAKIIQLEAVFCIFHR